MSAEITDRPVGITDLAALLGLKRTAVYYWLRRAQIRLHTFNGRSFIYESEVPAALARIRRLRGESLPEQAGGLTVPEAAERAGVAESTMRTLIRMSRVDVKRYGRHVRVTPQSLEDYMEGRLLPRE